MNYIIDHITLRKKSVYDCWESMLYENASNVRIKSNIKWDYETAQLRLNILIKLENA